MTEISVIPVSSSIREPEKLWARADRFLDELNTIEGFVFRPAPGDGEEEGLGILLVLSGESEIPAVEYGKNRPGPFILLAHPQDDSFPAALEALAYLRGIGKKAVVVQAFGDWKKDLRQLLTVYTAGNEVRQSRIGRIGEEKFPRYPLPTPVEELVKKTWGPEIVEIPFSALAGRFGKLRDDPRLAGLVKEMAASSRGMVEPGADELKKAAVLYLALRELVDEYEVDAVAVNGFNLLPVLKSTACFALAKLNAEGVMAACGGDIITATAMLIAKEVTGRPAFMSTPCMVDVEKALVTLACCPVPRTTGSVYKLRSPFGPPDEYTLFRIGGKDLQEIYTALTACQRNGENGNYCHTQVTLKFHDPKKAEELLSRPLGNQHLVIRGRHEEKLRQYHDLFLA
jgi:hypothetical protein